MADILNVSFKIDTGNLEGDAAAAGKLAAKAFEQGFGALDLKAVGQRISAGLGSGKAAEPAVKANDAAAEKHAAVRHGGDGGDGGEGERGGEGEGSPLHKGIEGLTAAMEGLTKLVEGGSLLAAAPALLSGLKGLGGSALDAGEGLTGISLLRRLAGRFGVGRASEDELEGVGTMFGGEQSAMAGAAGRMAALRRGEEKEVINQRLHDLGLGGVRPAVAAAGETGAAEGIAGAAAAAGGGLLGSLPGGGIGTAIGGAVGGPPGAVVGGVLGKLIGGAAGAFAITKLTEGAVKGAEAIKDVGLEAAHTDERLHNMAEIIGTSFEKFMRVREVAAKGGVDLDDWARGFTRLAIQIRKELPEVERQYEDSGNVMTESNIKVKDSERGITEARLAREAATDQTKKAEAALAIEQELGPETREEQREAAALGVSGAAVGMEGAQFGLARAQLKLAFAPQEQAFGDITGPNAIANADVSIGGAVIRARQADIADREAHGERVSGAEKRQLRMDAADQALWAANQGVTNAQVAFRGAVLQNQERKAANDAGLGPEGQAALGYDQAVQAVKQAALAQKQAETQQKMVETMTRLADRMAGPEAQRAVEGAQTQEGKAADNQTQAAIAENRAKKDQRLFALYGDKPTVTQALQGKPPEMRPGEGDYDYSQIGPADLHAALLHRGAQMGGGAFGAINAMGEAIQKVSDLRPEEGTQFGLSAVSSLFPSLRGFRGNEGPEALKHLVDLVNSPAARGPGGLAGALSPENMEELQPYIDLNTKKLPEARGLIEKERGAFSTGEQQTQKTGLEAIPAAGAVVQTGEVGAKVGGGVAQAALGALNTAVSGIGNAFSGAAGIIGSGASSVGGALGALASKLSGWSPPAAGSGGKGGGGGGGHEADVLEQAGGGLISGPGSGTSDSIPAWLSHGEYIVKADSVQKLGVPFLDRLNAGGFAFGGLVRGFAEGGAVDDDQAKRKAALEQLRLKMPLFGRGIFDDPDWATPLGDKIRLEHADKIRPPAAVGGGSDDASPPSLPMQRAEMWRSRSIRSHPAVESPDVKERPGDEMADVAVDYGWGNKKTFSVHKNKSPTPEQGPENAGNLDGYRWQGGILWKGGTPISDQTGERELGGAQPHQHHEPHQPTGLETPFESLPAVHAPIAEHPHHAPHRRRADASDDDMWNPDRKLAFGGLIPGFASSGGLARVSNGEYRIGAGAVTKYGAGVMAMLNQGRFDSGGLVGGASNPGRFDDWGNGISRGLSASLPPGVSTQDHGSSSQHTLDLVTSAGQFRMQASQDTIEAIRSSAIGQKLTSAGTKPSWY